MKDKVKTVEFRDIVNIDHPVVKGTGLVKGFRNDKDEHVEVEAIEVVMCKNSESVKVGRVMNIERRFLTVNTKFDWDSAKLGFSIEDDDLMQELFDGEDKREAAIPVIDHHIGFVGTWI